MSNPTAPSSPAAPTAPRDPAAADNARIRAALDSVGTNVMIANAELEIVYLNPSLIATLREAEEAIAVDSRGSRSTACSGARSMTFTSTRATSAACSSG